LLIGPDEPCGRQQVDEPLVSPVYITERNDFDIRIALDYCGKPIPIAGG